jgi:hypothetical protein
MRWLTSSCLAVLTTCATAAYACETPAMIPLPDGKTSTEQQLLAAQKEVKAYMAAMNEYLACVDGEAEAKGEDAPEQFKAMMVTRHNTAVTEMETVAAAFNDQVKAFKAANPKPAAN